MSLKTFLTSRLPFLRSKQQLDRKDALRIVPIRNPLVETEVLTEGGVLLRVPVDVTSKSIRWAVSAFRLPPHRQVQLDDIGGEVWQLIDGHRSVDGIVQKMCASTKMSRREVEASVSMFLKLLADRRLIGFSSGGDR